MLFWDIVRQENKQENGRISKGGIGADCIRRTGSKAYLYAIWSECIRKTAALTEKSFARTAACG